MPKEYIVYTDSSRESAYTAALDLLALENRPQAIICENNMIALGVVKAIEHSDLQVPEKIAFLTFDRYPYTASLILLRQLLILMYMIWANRQASQLHENLKIPSLLVQSFTTLPILIRGLTT